LDLMILEVFSNLDDSMKISVVLQLGSCIAAGS